MASLTSFVGRDDDVVEVSTLLAGHRPVTVTTRALGLDRTRAAQERGATMSMQAVSEFALMLADAPAPSQAPAGLTQLSAREQELVTLVAKGRNDAQIATPSCSSASAPFARTWIESGTRPVTAAALT